MSNEPESVHFVETQHFPRFWFWFIVGPLGGLMWYGFYQQIILGKPFGTNPVPDTFLVIFWFLFGIGLPWMFYSAKLITEVRSDSLHIRFTRLVSRTVHFRDLKSYEAGQYRPIRDFGG